MCMAENISVKPTKIIGGPSYNDQILARMTLQEMRDSLTELAVDALTGKQKRDARIRARAKHAELSRVREDRPALPETV
jgi:hypothetical protein